MPYEVTRNGETERLELIYRYEEPVFDPSSVADRNLASMIGSQVALNYGLFCREIVFRGPFDRQDRRFLEEYAAHTAREIFAVKFLEPNPFLGDSARNLPNTRRDSWLKARLSFEDDPLDAGEAEWAAPVAGRHAVLSSGGKDSLLTYGMLKEIGQEVHSIFVNESGRHWFTALNAYRHFEKHVPHTGRVWTNSDRVFSSMLNHLTFMKRDWHRVRADIYPVRLWTVPVFLFGALPLMRKRGIGAVSLGCEYDTTVRSTRGGVTHYGGLYDQSRWFDQAMTRWFRSKGWNVLQYSVLRPLSELLIMKMLTERYPELQRLQVSCHAAHVEGDIVRPCGKCEKCRRIVGMLEALGADAGRCGYTPEQIRRCLGELKEKGIHQESAGARHLEHLLAERGVLPSDTPTHPRPEILQVRIDPERSPVDTIPRPLRARLYPIYMEHAAGAVQRAGRRWAEVDLLTDEMLARPHQHETLPPDGSGDRDEVLWGSLTWPDARARLGPTSVALLPVGAIEQHGPHLPLDVDAYDAERLAVEVAERCSNPRPLVLPVIPYGVSYHHDDFPGTISVGPDTLAAMVREIGVNVARQGIDKLIIVNGHGGNGPALHFAAQLINRDAHIFTCVDTGESSDADVDAL
ncbi:MAG: creatininase family protein, partial [Acidobacteria bacterium]|nr:creatininase family protein [Candidatus Polarisedimenticola svalbardensis]